MQERVIRQGLVMFTKGPTHFQAHFVNPASEGPPGQVVNENKWVLSEMVWQSHKSRRPIQRAPRKRRARPKQIGVFDSLAACRRQLSEIDYNKDGLNQKIVLIKPT